MFRYSLPRSINDKIARLICRFSNRVKALKKLVGLFFFCCLLGLSPAGFALEVSPFVTGGFTTGGDVMDVLPKDSSGNERKIKAGGEFFIAAGLAFPFMQNTFVPEISLAYHSDAANDAGQGAVNFDRWMIELLPRLNVWRDLYLGVGTTLQYKPSLNCQISGSSNNCYYERDFKSSIGWMLQAEYRIARLSGEHILLSLRYANIQYESEQVKYSSKTVNSNIQFNGSYLGAMLKLVYF